MLQFQFLIHMHQVLKENNLITFRKRTVNILKFYLPVIGSDAGFGPIFGFVELLPEFLGLLPPKL